MARRRRRKHRKQGLSPAVLIAGAAAAALAVLLIALFTVRGCSVRQTGAGVPETAALPETGQESLQSEMETLSQGETESTQEAAADTEPETVIAAEVGSMEDDQDPQSSTNTAGSSETGAAVDMSQVSVPEGETTEATLGIDVSKYQGTIDWAKVKEAGVEFAMIRVGYRTKATGVIYEDPGARYNLQEATRNGILAGAYFFSSAVTQEEAIEEAAWVAGFVSKYKITYPIAYNCEDFQSPDSRQYGLSKEERTGIACAFLDTVAAKGYTPMFYASRNEMEGSAQWDMDTLEQKYRIWVSQYPEMPFPETPGSSYSGTHAMWQYTSQGQVSGIDGDVDLNVAYFGYSQEAQAKDPNPAQIVEANPEVGLNFKEVEETVTAKDVTNLRNLPTTENSEVVHSLKNGETVLRTGIGSNGWDRVIYEGQRLYAVHSFLTTDLAAKAPESSPETEDSGKEEQGADGSNAQETGGGNTFQAGGLTFRTVNEAVTARDQVNLRDLPSTQTGNIVGTLSYGQAVVRTGISGSDDTGWSRLEVNGQTVYASSRLLATSMDYKEQEKITTENPEAGMHFVAASGTVMAKSGETNLRTLPTTNEPSQVVAQLTGTDTAQRVAVDPDRGWTKLNYNGQTVYAVSSYLTVVE